MTNATQRASSSAPAALADLAERAFARAAGAPATEGNAVRMLCDARENFPAWRDALVNAKRYIFFESYIVEDDRVGREFADLLAQRARAGVRVLVIVDWLGSWRDLAMWRPVREAGADVRVFNPPHISSPLGWLSRDHRKTIVVDGEIGFVSGLCVSERWLGDPRRRLEPWRDTGIEIRGPAIASLEQAFLRVFATSGDALDTSGFADVATIPPAGPTRLHVIANEPNLAGTFRMDLVIAAIARKELWLTDAYFVATSPYVQALRAAARDGVDVRLLVPGASDIPALSPLSRAQYRPLLEAGVRVFEWAGTMMHAKTAVADRRWSRVGSTNLNLASWMSNYELDVAIEDAAFAELMATQYQTDLEHTVEIVLTPRNRVRRAAQELGSQRSRRAASGSAGRAAAGAFSVGSALGAALTDRRILGPAEAGLLFLMAAVAVLLGILGALWPRVLAWPLAFVALWSGTAWAVKGIALRRGRRSGARAERLEDAMDGTAHTDDAPGKSTPRPSRTSKDETRDRVTSR
ncbi:MAG TPA: phospholipase D-like domain-containing protein [Casimicrobiaceae bacterium]|nr:phospholipase D-like domain-containing protein [Casimicrobiaceae bacterium]